MNPIARAPRILLLAAAVTLTACAASPVASGTASSTGSGQVRASTPESERTLSQRVEIVRTEYGVPHVYADDLEAFGFAMGWLQMEDYGVDVARGLIQARGEYALNVGRDSIDGDFGARRSWLRAAETHERLDVDTRAVYAGFAAGVNHYVRLHRDEMPAWMEPDFTAWDTHARDVQSWSGGDAAAFVRGLERRRTEGGASGPSPDRDDAARQDAYLLDGSNAWALAPSRTTTGNAILLRNPHLTWGAGYYEAHAVVPGHFDFYGDFRIGGAFGIIGGFNDRLGWATTNNYPTYSQVYKLEAMPDSEAGYRLDGADHAFRADTTTVRYRTATGGEGTESRVTQWTSLGPVIHREGSWIYVIKDPRDGEYRRGEQFLRMMEARDLDQWLDVMHMRAHPSSNFTYADADGNIVHYYNARLPLLPHAMTGDTAATALDTEDAWSELVPWDDLPLYVNPPGGYVMQSNDTPDYTNLFVPLDRDTVAATLPPRRLRLRSQLALDLLHETGAFSLEDVVERKHSPRMLVAERTLDELLAALDRAQLAPAERRGRDVLAAWDRTARADSRGGVLFKEWWNAYEGRAGEDGAWARPWSPVAPTTTPRGLGDRELAVTTFRESVATFASWGVALDVPWGEVHRVVRGEVDAPVSGCEPTLGCFRALSYEELPDGRRAANRGDAWVFAVEFGDQPRAYSILAYGETSDPDSPHFDDQAGLFARGEMKAVRWSRAEVDAHAVRRYSPGTEAAR